MYFGLNNTMTISSKRLMGTLSIQIYFQFTEKIFQVLLLYWGGDAQLTTRQLSQSLVYKKTVTNTTIPKKAKTLKIPRTYHCGFSNETWSHLSLL